jgi:hypothetical protein
MTRIAALVLFALLGAAARGEDAFVSTTGFHAGLHQDRGTGSPIVKLVPAGAALQVLKREDKVTMVRDSDGVQGWIDNSFLAAEPPAESADDREQRRRIEDLERQLQQARTELEQMEARLAGSGKASEDFRLAQQLKRENAELERQLRQEKLRAGEVQVELTELRKRIGMSSDNESLYREIAALQAENRKLRIVAGEAAEGGDAAPAGADGGAMAALTEMDPARFAASAAVLLLIGFGGGLYLMDYLNRRRHGGFRV